MLKVRSWVRSRNEKMNMASCFLTAREEKAERDSESSVRSLHNKLLYVTIAINYLHSIVNNGIPEQEFRASVRKYVDDPLSISGKDAGAILEILEKKGLIDLGDYDILKDIATFDARIIKEITTTELALQSHGIPTLTRVGNGTEKKPKEYYIDRGKEIDFYIV